MLSGWCVLKTNLRCGVMDALATGAVAMATGGETGAATGAVAVATGGETGAATGGYLPGQGPQGSKKKV